MNRSLAGEIAGLFKDPSFHLVQGASHWPQHDQPEVVAQGIRQETWGKHMILIALTGWGHEDDKRRALDAGFNHHLTKPVKPEDVDALISAHSALQ